MITENYYLNIFGTDVPTLDKLVATALSNGGDYCDLYFENTVYFNLMLKDGAVTSGGCHTDFGVGIRVLKGEKTGYAYSETTELSDMMAAARAASAIALTGGMPLNYGSTRDCQCDIYPDTKDWREAETSSIRQFLENLADKVSHKDNRIIKVLARASYSMSDVMCYNSLRELTTDTRPMGSVTVSAVFQQGDKTETKTASRSFRMGYELLSDGLAEELAEEVVKRIDERFEARRPKGGQMPVVMGAGASGILLHEAMGHSFEADFNRKGQSIFSDKLGRKICSENILSLIHI